MSFLETTIYRIIVRSYIYLEQTGRENSFDRFPFLRVLTERLTEEALEEWQFDTGLQAQRYRRLLSRMIEDDSPKTDILCTAFDLCLATMYVPEFTAYLTYYTGNPATIQLACEIEGFGYVDYSVVCQILKKIDKACLVDWENPLLPYAAITGDNLLLAYLTGETDMTQILHGQAVQFWQGAKLHPMFIRKNLAEEGARWLEDSQISFHGRVLHICGKGGRRFLAKHISLILRKKLLLISGRGCSCFFESGGETQKRNLVRCAFLQEAAVCIHDITASLLSQLQTTEEAFLISVVLPFLEANIPVILCTDSDVRFLSVDQIPVWNLELKETTREEREAVFHGFGDLYHLSIDPSLYSVRFRLSASEIAKAVETLPCKSQREAKELSKICDTILYSKQKQILGKILYPSVSFADLKVPESIQSTLGHICTSVKEGYRIFEDWNLKHLYPYGRAVTVLITGPPGTGKTMTAHVIANELGIALYQVDLSLVMDKYIGETEKHLEQIFSFAERSNPVLFFDEADSLFGKRGEVAEGKDRYANMEVSYILQRIEQFDGIVILATNFYHNIDKAFLRRMKYVLKYQAPDKSLRKCIWEACLPPELPRESLDIDFLAQQFDLTGGTIKNAIYIGCVMAIHEGIPLNMRHIMRAVKAEYEKMERMVTKDMWGTYGYLIEDRDL